MTIPEKFTREGYPDNVLASSDGYQVFVDPTHPLATKDGQVRLHLHLASVSLGRWLHSDEHVYFDDRDRSNLAPENLKVVTTRELGMIGRSFVGCVVQKCANCGKLYLISESHKDRRKTCSLNCKMYEHKITLTNDELRTLTWAMSTEKIGELLGCSGKAIEKKCKKEGIEKPPRGYWAKVHAGKIVIDPALRSQADIILDRLAANKPG